jgi:hypothetical protein
MGRVRDELYDAQIHMDAMKCHVTLPQVRILRTNVVAVLLSHSLLSDIAILMCVVCRNFVASRRQPMPPARPLAIAAIPQNHLQHAARELCLCLCMYHHIRRPSKCWISKSCPSLGQTEICEAQD